MAKAHAKTTAGAGGVAKHGGKKTLTGRQKAAIFWLLSVPKYLQKFSSI